MNWAVGEGLESETSTNHLDHDSKFATERLSPVSDSKQSISQIRRTYSRLSETECDTIASGLSILHSIAFLSILDPRRSAKAYVSQCLMVLFSISRAELCLARIQPGVPYK